MEYSFTKGSTFNIGFEKIYTDFDVFTRALIGSKDVDPTYPMIRDIGRHYGFEDKWWAFMYHAFYSLESAIVVCSLMPTKEDWDETLFRKLRTENKMNFGYERRGLRMLENQVQHIKSVIDFIPTMEDHMKDNPTYQKAVAALPHNGGWASYKNAEIFEKGYDYNTLEIPNLGIDHRNPNSDRDGPVPALRLMYGWDNLYDGKIKAVWDRFGANLASEYGVSIGQIETSLCKYIKPVKGKYYIGHDIEEFHHLKDTMDAGDWLKIMRKNFDDRFMVNVVTSDDIRRKRKVYAETGKYLNADFKSSLSRVNVLDVLLKTD